MGVFFSLQHISWKIVNKYANRKFKIGQESNDWNFHFTIKKPDFNKQWNRFVNRIIWEPTQKFILYWFVLKEISSIAPCNFKWQLNPLPTFHSKEILLKSPSSLSPPFIKKWPQYFKNIRCKVFCDQDIISRFDKLKKNHALLMFIFSKNRYCVV